MSTEINPRQRSLYLSYSLAGSPVDLITAINLCRVRTIPARNGIIGVAVRHVDPIVAVSAVDCVCVGPGGVSYGVAVRFTVEDVVACRAIEDVVAVAAVEGVVVVAAIDVVNTGLAVYRIIAFQRRDLVISSGSVDRI